MAFRSAKFTFQYLGSRGAQPGILGGMYVKEGFNTWAREEPNQDTGSAGRDHGSFNTWAREEPNGERGGAAETRQCFNTWAREEPN